MKNIIYERFDSIHSLLNTINSRPNNEIMKNENDSQKKKVRQVFMELLHMMKPVNYL